MVSHSPDKRGLLAGILWPRVWFYWNTVTRCHLKCYPASRPGNGPLIFFMECSTVGVPAGCSGHCHYLVKTNESRISLLLHETISGKQGFR